MAENGFPREMTKKMVFSHGVRHSPTTSKQSSDISLNMQAKSLGIGYVIPCKIASIATSIKMDDATINRVECSAENITFETQIMNSTSRGNG